MRSLVPILLVYILSGCTHYEFDLVRPPEQARHIGTSGDAVVPMQPLEYRLRAYENILVMRIFNPADAPVALLGSQSTVVDPGGQSHPLRAQAIAPQSYIKLLFPPPRPTYYAPGPAIGFGFGTRIGYRSRHDPFWEEPFDPAPPRFLAVYDSANSMYWTWDGQSDVRVTLVYRSGQNGFQHEFLFRRVKAK